MPIPSTSATQVASQSGFASEVGEFDAMRRFDAPHHGKVESAKGDDSAVVDASPVREVAIELDPSTIRAAHADDLVEFLQHWSEELDARSAKLHADIATHERRERAFRLWMQNRRLDLESQLAEAQEAQSRAEAAARRFAISHPS